MKHAGAIGELTRKEDHRIEYPSRVRWDSYASLPIRWSQPRALLTHSERSIAIMTYADTVRPPFPPNAIGMIIPLSRVRSAFYLVADVALSRSATTCRKPSWERSESKARSFLTVQRL